MYSHDRNTAWLRITGIIIRAVFGVSVLVYIGFYTGSFSLFQKLIVLLVALILYGAAESILRVARSSWVGRVEVRL